MTIFKKENGFKQFFALLVVVTLICPGVLSAKKKGHGALITVIKKDGQLVQGELLKVNDSEILLMSCSQSGNTIPVNEIKMIESKKKGKFLTGAAIGFGIGIIAGGLLGSKYKSEGIGFAGGVILWGGILGIPSGLIFGAASSLVVNHKTYKFQHASPEIVSINLKKLKKLARF